jgi:dienelactone hydrolase
LSDGFGIFPNAKLLADKFAASGYLTVLPDLFEGDPFPDPRPANFDLQKWLKEGAGGRGHLLNTVDPIVEKTIDWMRNEKGIKKIGGVGYCFGGKARSRHLFIFTTWSLTGMQYVVRYLRPPFIDVGFIAHPTNTTASEVSAITGPLSIAAAENDPVFTIDKRYETENLLRKNASKVEWQISIYSKVEHGFAVRTDRSVKQKRWAIDQAFEQARVWMKELLVE